MLKDPKVYTLSLVYFLLLGATYTMVFWLPTLIKSWGITRPVHDRHLCCHSNLSASSAWC